MKNARSASSVASRLFPSRKKLLLCALLLASSPVMALESLDDEVMSSVNGEGIAFLPQQVQMALQSPGTGFPGSTTADITNRANDTGYIRYIPVGPLSDTALAQYLDAPTNSKPNPYYGTTGKADVFLYGLALSRADSNINVNTRMNADATASNRYIESWGTATNPWLLKVQSQAGIPNFDTGTGSGTVSYIALEAPLYDITLPASRALGLDAYNLKLAFWGDVFDRKWDAVEGATNQFDVGLGLLRSDGSTGCATSGCKQNRLRLQMIWDGFSINGSNIKMFQTLGGATNSGGMSTFYNNTFGMAALFRLNSGDSTGYRAVITGSINRTQSAYSVIHNAENATYTVGVPNGTGSSCNNTVATVAPNYGASGCQFRVQRRTTVDTVTSTWTPPASKIFRISTQETSGTSVDLTTPAINGGSAPTFAANEGLYLYSPNINLPLGSLAQPLTAGVASDGRNFVLEIARIPNKSSAYTAIYTDYTSNADVIAKNCNVHRCGTALSSPLSGYQASSATHGSISIGSTLYNSSTNLLTAYSGVDSVGVSFGAQTARTESLTSQTYNELQYMHRQQYVVGTQYTRKYSCGFLGTSTCYDTADVNAWQYRNAAGTYVSWNPPTFCNNTGCAPGTAAAVVLPPVCNRDWNGLTGCTGMPAGWITPGGGGSSAALDSQVQSLVGTTHIAPPAGNTYTISSAAISPTNNFGSAVIDGVLIQHLKFTTTGL